jgi:hypothetical protein
VKTILKILMWTLFIAAFMVTLLLGLDTFGIRPWKFVQKDKVSDLVRDIDLSAGQRYYLMQQKTIIDGRIKAFKGDKDQKEAAKAAINDAVDSFAKRDYNDAEANMKLAKLALSSKWTDYIKNQEANKSKLLSETITDSTAIKPTVSKDTSEMIMKKIGILEERLSGITDPSIDADDAWIYLDRTLNALRSGNAEQANYFLTETEIAVEDLTR